MQGHWEDAWHTLGSLAKAPRAACKWERGASTAAVPALPLRHYWAPTASDPRSAILLTTPLGILVTILQTRMPRLREAKGQEEAEARFESNIV